jgi:hypothetical protein
MKYRNGYSLRSRLPEIGLELNSPHSQVPYRYASLKLPSPSFYTDPARDNGKPGRSSAIKYVYIVCFMLIELHILLLITIVRSMILMK